MLSKSWPLSETIADGIRAKSFSVDRGREGSFEPYARDLAK